MAEFKCKSCGGSLALLENMTVAECEYCGLKQTLPRLDDEKKAALYDRANHFRRNNDYDKAAAIFEQILEEDTTDAEAYWSLVLCRYGIEYVEDPATKKRVPTVNRAQYTSIFADENYKSAIEYADAYQKELYEKEAKAIDEIQKGIIAISQTEEPFDVFICYKESDANGRRTPDSVLANDLYHQLTNEGFKVFFARITLEDKLGSAYEPYIFAALNSSKVMVALGTKPEYFNAAWVKNEWSRYLALIKGGAKKILIPAYKDMDPYDLPEEFSHLQAQDMSKLGFMQDLIRGIKKLTDTPEKQAGQASAAAAASAKQETDTLLKRVFMFLGDGDFASADAYCEKVLDIAPENGRAYLGKLMVDMKCVKEGQLSSSQVPFGDNKNYKKAIMFLDAESAKKLKDSCAIVQEKYDHKMLLERQSQAIRKREEEERIRLENIEKQKRYEAEQARKAEEARRQREKNEEDRRRREEQERRDREERERERAVENRVKWIARLVQIAIAILLPIIFRNFYEPLLADVNDGAPWASIFIPTLAPSIATLISFIMVRILNNTFTGYFAEEGFFITMCVISNIIHFVNMIGAGAGFLVLIIITVVNILCSSFLCQRVD